MYMCTYNTSDLKKEHIYKLSVFFPFTPSKGRKKSVKALHQADETNTKQVMMGVPALPHVFYTQS